MDAMRKGNVKIPSIDEFNKLMKFTDDISNRFTTAQGKRYNKEPSFNLDPNVLPFDHNRVRLKNTADKIDYVNASWLAEISEEPSYDEVIYTKYAPYHQLKFIVGQNPLGKTMQHHFALIHENRVDLVAHFHDGQMEDRFDTFTRQ